MTRARVVYEKHGHVASITLDRPEVLNALDLQTHAELCEIWNDFERDDDMRVGVLSGRGTRAFSVGQDLKELAQRDQAGAAPSSFGSRGRAGWPRLTERFAFSKPVVAKVCGHALGGGFELALACDIVVAADNASFALPEAKLGLIAGAGGLFRLPRQIPAKVAMGHLMTGRPITAERAYALGLVNEVAPLAQVDACVQGWVDDLLRAAPLSLRAIKEVGARSSHLSLEAAFAADYKWEAVRRESADCKEGPRAFAEKRAPVWRGR